MSQLFRMVCVCAITSALAMGCGNQAPAPAENVAPGPKGGETAPQAAAQPTATVAPTPEPPKPPAFKIVKSWDFVELEKPHWQWVFPADGALETPQGAFYHTLRSGVGPQLSPPIYLEASEVSAIRVTLELMRKGEGDEKPTPLKLPRMPIILWASPEDLEVDGWVYTESKRLAFELVNPDNPNRYQVDLRKHENWKGEIARLAVTVPLPEELDEEEQPFNVFFKRIEFLK